MPPLNKRCMQNPNHVFISSTFDNFHPATKNSLPVYSEYTLYIVRRIPAGVEDDDSVGARQVDAQATGSGGYQEEPGSRVLRIVEYLRPGAAVLRAGRAVQPEVIQAEMPGTRVVLQILRFDVVLGIRVDQIQEVLDERQRVQGLREHEPVVEKK